MTIGGETTWGESVSGETTWGESIWGRIDLGANRLGGETTCIHELPTCAAINGIPSKAFVLLLGMSKLAFQKLIQAPRSKQLKINGKHR